MIFEDEDEKETFKNYVFRNWSRRQEFLCDYVMPDFYDRDDYIKQELEWELENAYVLTKLLDCFRK